MKYLCSNILKTDLFHYRNTISLLLRLQSTVTTASENSSISTEDEQEQIEIKDSVDRNKSRLLPQHRNMLLGKVPYDEPQSWIHLTENYQRKLFAKYGFESNVDPRICFYTKDQKKLMDEYESVAYPYTIQEMMKMNEEQKQIKKLQIQKREDDIAKKISKLEQWKSELNAKIAKKEAEALAAKQRKERLIEEVRRHFGFKVDPRDERFKELLEQKEKEERKKQKEAKRKAKEDKMMKQMVETTAKHRQEMTTTKIVENEDTKKNLIEKKKQK